MKLLNLMGGLVPLAIGLCAIVGSVQLNIGKLNDPGAGMWPLILAVVLTVSSIILLLTDSKKDYREKFVSQSRNVLYAVIAIVLFILLFVRVGVEICSFILLIYFIRFIGNESWKMTIGCAIGVTVMVSVVFVLMLKIPLPSVWGVL